MMYRFFLFFSTLSFFAVAFATAPVSSYKIIQTDNSAAEAAIIQSLSKGNTEEALEMVSVSLPNRIVSEVMVYQAIIYARSGDTAKAQALVAKALKENPNSIKGLVLSGYLSLATGDYAGAYQAQQKAVSLDPTYGPAQLGLARFYHAIGDSSAAAKGYTEAILKMPNDSDLYYERSMVYLYGDALNPTAALRDIERYKVLRGKPSDALTFLEGLAYTQQSNDTKAIARLAPISKATGAYYLAQGLLCRLYFRNDMMDKAMASCRAVVDYASVMKTTNPDLLRYAFLHQGIISLRQDQDAAAVTVLTAGITIFPYMPELYFQRALAYHRLQQDSASLKDAQQAKELFFSKKL